MRKIFAFLPILLLIGVYTRTHANRDCQAGQWNINGECVSPDELTLNEGWNTVLPGGETACAHNTPFQFWVHPGGSDDLLVYFQGGGGCWSAETCQQGSSWYNQTAQRNGSGTGVFDFDNPDNPFADYTHVVVPSCTGDVYMGAKIKEYSDDVTVYHHGFINLSSALQFVFDTIEQPHSIFVTGCSAGSPGSAIAAPYLIQHYPDIPVYQLGDSLGAIFDTPDNMEDLWGVQASLPDWIPDMPSAESFTMSDYYIALANYYPDYHFGQYNSLYDRVQQGYFSIGQDDPAAFLAQTLDDVLNTIGENAPNFHAYTAEGDLHCITPRNQFYSYEVNGVRFVDWIAAYAKGEAVETIHCEGCKRTN